MGNVKLLANKIDKFGELRRTQREYRECSIMCFTEAWLRKHIPDSNSNSSKSKDGGIAVLVGVILDISLVRRGFVTRTLKCKLWVYVHIIYRESFICVILVAVNRLAGTTADTVCEVIGSVVARLQTQHLNAFAAKLKIWYFRQIDKLK